VNKDRGVWAWLVITALALIALFVVLIVGHGHMETMARFSEYNNSLLAIEGVLVVSTLLCIAAVLALVALYTARRGE